MSHSRKTEDIKRLKSLYDKTKNSYGAGVWYNENKNRYYRYSCHNIYEKKRCRKAVRRKLKNSDYLLPGCLYKKVSEYWWMIL